MNHFARELTAQIIGGFWRLRRIPIIEAALYRRGCEELAIERAQNVLAEFEKKMHDELLESLQVADSDRDAYKDVKSKLESVRVGLDEPTLNIARVFATYPGPFTNLWRHEFALSRSLSKTLHELQRLQAKRAGECVAAPSMVDVNISLPDAVEETDKQIEH